MTDLRQVDFDDQWTHILQPEGQAHLEEVLPDYLPECRWFQSKARDLDTVKIIDAVPTKDPRTQMVLLEIIYTDGVQEVYLLPLKLATGLSADELVEANPVAGILRVRCRDEDGTQIEGVLIDAIYDHAFREDILAFINAPDVMESDAGAISTSTTRAFDDLYTEDIAEQGKLIGREQSNTSIKYGDALILKLMRKLEMGVNPELEIGRFLTEKTDIEHVPLLAGYMEYTRTTKPPVTLAVLQSFVPNEGDAWEFALDWLSNWLQAGIMEQVQDSASPASFVMAAQQPIPDEPRERIGDFLDKAALLGQRTADLHVALASGQSEKFIPEYFSMTYQESLYNSIMLMCDRVFTALRNRVDRLPEAVRWHGRAVLDEEEDIRAVFGELKDRDIPGMRIRGHGDYHLGQVLYTGDDFVIVDFEGEPARSLKERYVKHSPLRDVAGMLRSFHYAAYGVLPGFGVSTSIPMEKLEAAEAWARYWRDWTSIAFLRSYFEYVAPADILPESNEDVSTLMRIVLMEKAVYELGYEINNRPTWLKVPARAIIRIAE